MREAEKKGYRAYVGSKPHKNPYKKDSEEFYDYESGWKEAETDVRNKEFDPRYHVAFQKN